MRHDHPPILPYDVYAAARFFLSTGRSREAVLARVGLDDVQWSTLEEVYAQLGGHETRYRPYFGGLDDAAIVQRLLAPRWSDPSGQQVSFDSLKWHIGQAVLARPHIGPFEQVDWVAVHIATHPDMRACYYSHDGKQVYFAGEPLTRRNGQPLGADPASFRWLGGRWLCDDLHVYGQGQVGEGNAKRFWYIVEGADRASFTPLNLGYAKDALRAYYITNKTLRTKSPAAFEIVPEVRLNFRDASLDPLVDTSAFARDAEYVYFYGVRLRGADPAGFRVVGDGYSTDGQGVWYHEDKLRIEGADAATFRVPVPGEPYAGRHHGATDRLRSYVCGEPQDPHHAFESWRAFFEFHTDLRDWWWHREAARRG
ncbi:DKNYY domain-containing protein [Bordetella sp. BOR01]|uniref:DKNYY domain-containing protein n=1 Tax=Bordetella sp. BOR01 TaxID=2854779 RepID=UPI001C437510|nr:DKNYY domain-containing protein [Bordetella sp. BOR01]MBV7483429.1 DKNYY domain-containing protein [Bordetella sp. BOR01]